MAVLPLESREAGAAGKSVCAVEGGQAEFPLCPDYMIKV